MINKIGFLSLLFSSSVSFGHFDLAPTNETSAGADLKFAQALQMPKSCLPASRDISKALFEYEDSSRDRTVDKDKPRPADEKKSRAALARISSILRLSESKAPECFAPLSMFYALHASADDFNPDGLLPSLYFKGALQPLSLKARRKLGSEWSKTYGGLTLHKILGGYDCAASKIYFDPYAAPFDVWAILQHELDHFLRDKFASVADLGFSSEEYLLVDELLASMHAGYVEMLDRTVMPAKLDLTLYNYWGHLAGILVDLDIRTIIIEPPYDTFPSYLSNAAYKPVAEKRMQELTKMVANAYFKNTRFDTGALLSKLVAIPTAKLLPDFDEPNRYRIVALSSAHRQELESALASTSKSCRDFSSGLSSGEFGQYLGAKVSKPGHGVRHARSVKPGTEGVKPGTEGVKPSVNGLRPCIHPASGF